VDKIFAWVIEAQPLLRAGLRILLKGEGFEITAEASSFESIADADQMERKPHLIIVDLSFGADTVARLKALHPSARVVAFAETADLPQLGEAFALGADGYLLKSISPEAMAHSLRLIALGEKVFPSRLTDALNGSHTTQPLLSDRVRVGNVSLSQREFEIARRLTGGRSNKSIARELDITEATVKVHLKTVLRKLRATNRTQVAIWAVQNGLNSSERPQAPSR
jgi:two-component system nitrate/nitrite response regulator NarL